MYGQELILDLNGVAKQELPLDVIARNFCYDVAKQLGVTSLGFSYKTSDPGDISWGNPKTQGLSAILFIIESSISVHWLPLLGQVFINVFSCKEFDEVHIVKLVRETFKPEVEIRAQLINRGEFKE